MLSRRIVSFAACVAVAALAMGAGQAASDKQKPSPGADPASKKETTESPPVSNEPQLTTAAFGDWVERCQRVNAGGEMRRLCEVALTVTATGQTAPLAEIAVGRVKKADPMRLTIVLPVNVGFPSAPKINLGEDNDPIELAWRQCVPAGCFADVTLSAETLHSLRDAKSAKVELKAAGGQAFNFAVSLRGLPQALDAMAKEP